LFSYEPEALTIIGLIAHWGFEEINGTAFLDQSGNNHTAYIPNSAWITEPVRIRGKVIYYLFHAITVYFSMDLLFTLVELHVPKLTSHPFFETSPLPFGLSTLNLLHNIYSY
jgi:hypothetical protein